MNRTMFFGGVLVVFLGACEFRVPDPPTSAWFVERENELGVPFVTRAYTEERRFDFPEIMLGGVGLADVDNDGDQDLYISNDKLDILREVGNLNTQVKSKIDALSWHARCLNLVTVNQI